MEFHGPSEELLRKRKVKFDVCSDEYKPYLFYRKAPDAIPTNKRIYLISQSNCKLDLINLNNNNSNRGPVLFKVTIDGIKLQYLITKKIKKFISDKEIKQNALSLKGYKCMVNSRKRNDRQ